MSDSTQRILKELDSKIESTYKSNMELITEETNNTVEVCQQLQNSSQKRFESYFNRKQIIDYLIYANLAITPILFIILAYILFFKK